MSQDERVQMISDLIDDYQMDNAELKEMTDEELQSIYNEFKHFKLTMNWSTSHE